MADSWRQIYFLGGQGQRILADEMHEGQRTVSGTGLRGGSVEDEVDCCSTVQDAELTVPRQGAA